MLLDFDGLQVRLVADGERRQFAAVLIVLVFVGLGLDAIEGEEAGEGDDGADGAQFDGAAGDVDGDIDGGAVDFGRFHLGGERAAPDQAIKLGLVGIEMQVLGPLEHVGRADGLVRFLGVLGLGLVDARLFGQVGVAEELVDGAAGHGDAFGRHLHGVGTHIGDQPVLVEALGDLHGAIGRQAEARGGVLLQARGGEGRIGIALGGLLFDGGDVEIARPRSRP